METLDHIHIFKTNLGKLCPNCEVAKTLDAEPAISQWTLDAEDVDCVLRVVSKTATPQNIIALVNRLGFECSELQ